MKVFALIFALLSYIHSAHKKIEDYYSLSSCLYSSYAQFHLSTLSHRISERLLNLKLLTITHFHILAHTTLAGKHMVNLNHIRSKICLSMDDCHVAALLVAQSRNEISSKNDE
jgi:hypothetical protein